MTLYWAVFARNVELFGPAPLALFLAQEDAERWMAANEPIALYIRAITVEFTLAN